MRIIDTKKYVTFKDFEKCLITPILNVANQIYFFWLSMITIN